MRVLRLPFFFRTPSRTHYINLLLSTIASAISNPFNERFPRVISHHFNLCDSVMLYHKTKAAPVDIKNCFLWCSICSYELVNATEFFLSRVFGAKNALITRALRVNIVVPPTMELIFLRSFSVHKRTRPSVRLFGII